MFPPFNYSGQVPPKMEIISGVFVLAWGVFIIVLSAIAGGVGGVFFGGIFSFIGLFFIGNGIRRLNRDRPVESEGVSREREQSQGRDAPECQHRALIPQWDDAVDIGLMSKVNRYTCQSCNMTFSPEEAGHTPV